jgi:outer membrane immunogenic protein
MRIIHLGSVALAILISGPAMAADLKAPAYKAPPATAAAYNWTGCYIGGHAGGGWGEARNRVVSSTPSAAAPVDLDPTGTFHANGPVIGGQVGCNYQFASNWVVGFEGDGAWAHQHGDKNLDPANYDSRFVFDLQERWLATARARVGYATDKWFLYVTGGGAWADVRAKLFFQPDPAACSFCNATGSQTFSGWTVGGGLEWWLVTNWSAKVEYLYVDLGRKTFFDPPGTGAYLGISTKMTEQIARVGINYHFNLGTPAAGRASY